ncbi:MAG TPA: InlB B-repeat-containing protein [Mogibacterium sp.]|nr:InlB B-repeat-containing protein [Mogibacterium sp.]
MRKSKGLFKFRIITVLLLSVTMMVTSVLGTMTVHALPKADQPELIYETAKVTLAGMPVQDYKTKQPVEDEIKFNVWNATLQQFEGYATSKNGVLEDVELVKNHHYIFFCESGWYEGVNLNQPNNQGKHAYLVLDETGNLPLDDRNKDETKRLEAIYVKQRSSEEEKPEDDKRVAVSLDLIEDYNGDLSDVKVVFTSDYETITVLPDEDFGFYTANVNLIEDMVYTVSVDSEDYYADPFPLTVKDHSERTDPKAKLPYLHFSCGFTEHFYVMDKEDAHKNDTPIESASKNTKVEGTRFFNTNNKYILNERVLENVTIPDLDGQDYSVIDIDTVNLYRSELSKLNGDFTVTYKIPEGKTVEKVYYINKSNELVQVDATQEGASVKFNMPAIGVYNNVILYKSNVPEPVEYTVSFDANGGSGEMSAATVEEGNTYKLPKNTFTAPENKEFKSWLIGEEEKNVGEEIIVNGNVTIKAVWQDKTEPPAEAELYLLMVESGEFDVDGDDSSDEIEEGKTVNIYADPAPNGKQFKSWEVLNGTGVEFADKNAVNTTFVMPASDVRIKATYEDKTEPSTDPENPPAEEFNAAISTGVWTGPNTIEIQLTSPVTSLGEDAISKVFLKTCDGSEKINLTSADSVTVENGNLNVILGNNKDYRDFEKYCTVGLEAGAVKNADGVPLTKDTEGPVSVNNDLKKIQVSKITYDNTEVPYDTTSMDVVIEGKNFVFDTANSSNNRLNVKLSIDEEPDFDSKVKIDIVSDTKAHVKITEIPENDTKNDQDIAVMVFQGWTLRNAHSNGPVIRKTKPVPIENALLAVNGEELTDKTYSYDGNEKEPEVIVTNAKGDELKEGKDYNVKYSDNINIGTAKVTVSGVGNYSGTIDKTFVINPAKVKVDIKLYGHDDIHGTWNESPAQEGVTVKYRVEYKRSTWKKYTELSPGTTATSRKKANLADGARYRFKVTPYVEIDDIKYYGDPGYSSYIYTLKKIAAPRVSKSSRNYVRLRWRNIPGESGYQIARSRYKTKRFRTVKRVSSKYSATRLKTPRNRRYYYKIRAYKTVDGRRIYAPWSKVRSYRLR